jgi:hypothetical protein
MRDYHLTVLVIGFGLAYGILHLVRRDHLYIRQGVFWIVIAFLSLALAIWPSFIDLLGGALGIAYPPTLLFLVAIVVLVVKALMNDIALTQIRRDLRRLNQRIALLETHEPLARDLDETATGGRAQPSAAKAEVRRVASS